MEFVEDMEIDIPDIWTYLKVLVGQMMQDGSVPVSFLKEATHFLSSNKAINFMAEILEDASHVSTLCTSTAKE